jgi:hypothetical protein
MIKYVLREEEPLRVKNAKLFDVQRVGEAIDAVRKLNNGVLHPFDVVNAARAAESPLHPHFEWDDATAAENWRVDQARHLIGVIRVVDDDAESGSVRAFVSLTTDAGRSYRSVADVRADAALHKAAIEAARRELEGFRRRFREIEGLREALQPAVDLLDRTGRGRRARRQSNVGASAAA